MKHALAALLLLSALTASADEFGTLVTVSGDTPTRVLFLKCRSLQREAADLERPASCKERETKTTFRAKTARVTNLGDTLVWIHVGEDKVPLLPKSVMTVGPGDGNFERIFFGVNDGETARIHVFASSDKVLDRAYVYPEPEKSR